jgi:anti-sigma-K factor RskA
MNLSAHPELLELLAASHALGTLRGGARRRFEAMAREQAAVRAVALAWQSRLASMAELQPSVTPDPAVWTRIRNLIDAEKQQEAIAAQRQAPPPPTPAKVGWLHSLALWRGAAAAGVFAAVVAIVVGLNLQQQLRNAPTEQYVAVLSDDKAAASMLVTFDPKNRQLVLQRLGDFRESEDKSLQLWALPPGGAPRSLGVLGSEATIRLTASEADVQGVPALAISLEPKGGVPAGQPPSGPILFKGPLIQKAI